MTYNQNFEFLEIELNLYNIKVYDYPFESCNAMTIKIDDHYAIGINSNKNFDKYKRFWLIEHEIEHIKNGTFYHMNDSEYIINMKERKTNDALIKKLGIVDKVIGYMLKGFDKWEICAGMEIPYEIYDCCISYWKRSLLAIMNNSVEELCLEHGYDALTLALRMGITEREAQDIIDQAVIIQQDDLKRLCQIFNTTPERILCI